MTCGCCLPGAALNVLLSGTPRTAEFRVKLCDLGSAHELPEEGTLAQTEQTASRLPGTCESSPGRPSRAG